VKRQHAAKSAVVGASDKLTTHEDGGDRAATDDGGQLISDSATILDLVELDIRVDGAPAPRSDHVIYSAARG
jgi:hypothetical protein